MVIVASPTLLVVVGARPLRKANGLIREFVKGLFDEFRTGQAMVDPEGFAAAFGDGRDARMGLAINAQPLEKVKLATLPDSYSSAQS